MLNHDTAIRPVGGARQRSPASNSLLSPYSFSWDQLPAICQQWKALAACKQVFPNQHTWLPFPVRDSAVHEPSAITNHWARKRYQPSQSLIDTHEKSLLVVVLNRGIIRWKAVHWPEKDIVKNALPPMKPL